MIHLPLKISGLNQTWPTLIADIAQARDLFDLEHRCAAALAAIMPECRFGLIWDCEEQPQLLIPQQQPITPQPNQDEYRRLAAGTLVATEDDSPGYVPLRVGG